MYPAQVLLILFLACPPGLLPVPGPGLPHGFPCNLIYGLYQDPLPSVSFHVLLQRSWLLPTLPSPETLKPPTKLHWFKVVVV